MSEETSQVSVNKNDLRDLIDANKALQDRVASLEKNATADESGKLTLKRVSERRVHVRFVDGKPVIGFANRGTDARPRYIYDKADPVDPKKIIQYVDLVIKGVDEPLPVIYTEFLEQAERVSCKILHKDIRPWEIEQGVTTRKEVQDYHMVDTDVTVPVVITGEVATFTVELPDKSELKIHEQYVNM